MSEAYNIYLNEHIGAVQFLYKEFWGEELDHKHDESKYSKEDKLPITFTHLSSILFGMEILGYISIEKSQYSTSTFFCLKESIFHIFFKRIVNGSCSNIINFFI